MRPNPEKTKIQTERDFQKKRDDDLRVFEFTVKADGKTFHPRIETPYEFCDALEKIVDELRACYFDWMIEKVEEV
jgi:hypothetical protein